MDGEHMTYDNYKERQHGPTDAEVMQELLCDLQDHIAEVTGADALDDEPEPTKITFDELLEIVRRDAKLPEGTD